MKNNVFSLGLEVFNTGVKIVDENSNISYGAYGRYVLDDEDCEIGFQASDQQYSYGWQVDGTFIENGKRFKVFYVLQEHEISNESLLFSGCWKKAVQEASNSDRPCYIISALDQIKYDLGINKLQPKIRFTNKAWNKKIA